MKFPRFSAFLAFSSILAFSGLASASNWNLMVAARVNSGGLPASVVSADFNHDGIPDLVMAQHKRNGSVIFFPGKGDGKFGKKVSFKTTGDPVYIVTGDFNHDTNMDLAVALFDNKAKKAAGKVEVFMGKDKADIVAGTFPFVTPDAVHTHNVGFRPVSIAMADLDGDGDLDLAVANFGDGTDLAVGTATVFLGDGLGAFTANGDFPTGVNPRQITAGDLNGDGVPDLAVTNMDKDANSFRIMYANTTTVDTVKHGTGSFTNFSSVPMPEKAAMPWGIAAADLDGDAITDLVVAEAGKRKIDVYFGKEPAGSFEPPLVMDTNSGPDFILVNDINQDGKPDLLIGEGGSNVLSVFINTGGRTFDTKNDFIAGAFPISIAVADLNRDGDPDIVTADNKSGALSVFLAKVTGKGAWGFAAPVADFAGGAWPKGLTAGAFTGADIVTADLNRDGVPDSAAIDAPNNAVVVSIAGATGDSVSYPVGGSPSAIISADINRDGKPDIAVANEGDSTVSVLFGNGDGTFQDKQDFAVGLSPVSMAVGDFGDPNGWLDIAVSATTPVTDGDGAVSVLFGQEQFDITIQVGPEGSGTVYKVVDISDDTKDELLTPGPHTFGFGEEVTLRERPANGFAFKSWSGGATGTDTTVSFTVKAKTTVKATFVAGP